MARFLALLLFAVALWAEPITLAWLKKQPAGRVRDFYVWRYFGQKITPAQADEAFYLIQRVTWKHIDRYAKKTKKPGFLMASKCRRVLASQLLRVRRDCAEIGITPAKFASLSPQKQCRLVRLLRPFEETTTWMAPMAEKNPFDALTRSGPKTFLKVFNTCGAKWRRAYLDRPLPESFVKKLAQTPGYERFVKLIVTDEKLHNLPLSLLGAPSEKLGHRGTFFLALNAVKQNKKGFARLYLAQAYKKAWSRMDKDKVLLWAYLVDGKRKWLEKLAKSPDIDIYSLYAKERLGIAWPRVEVPRFKRQTCGFDITDPFAWQKVRESLKGKEKASLREEAKRRFACQETEGHYAYLMARAEGFKTHYFPMPYEKALDGLNHDTKALVYALARQESVMIPAVVSSSYALGLMQLMPFLVKSLAKQKGEKVDLDAMFNPYKNLAYAREHLKFLFRRLDHPLFIAYAYNGGIGFTKRMLKNRPLFRKKGPYEPWLSMELVHYDESRRYGKRVLANYIVYKKLLGEPIGVASLLQTAESPVRKGRD